MVSLEDKISWHDVLTMPFEELQPIYDSHLEIIESSDAKAISKISHLHVRELEPQERDELTDKKRVLKYLAQLIETREIDSETYDVVLGNNAIEFSREVIKPSNKIRKDEGRFIETVKVYPNGTRVRFFRNTWDDDTNRRKADQGQRFYFGLLKYIKENYGLNQNIGKIIQTLRPIEPLHSGNSVLDNVFIGGQSGEEVYKNLSVEERVDKTIQMLKGDILVHCFANEYEKTKQGKKLSKKQGKLFYRSTFEEKKDEILIDIVLKLDGFLKKQLVEEGIVNKQGEVVDRKSYEKFIEDSSLGNILSLTGEERDSETAFVRGDYNLGNDMFSGDKTTAIDFERSRKDTLASILAQRILQSGLFDGNGKIVDENKVLRETYQTYQTIKQDAISFEDFKHNYNVRKKTHLLRMARRFKEYEETDQDTEKMRSAKRFYYTQFVKQLENEGISKSDSRLNYLSELFGEPLSNEEVSQAISQHNVDFITLNDYKPKNLEDVVRRREDIEEKLKEIRLEKRQRKIRKIGVIGGVVATLLGVIGLAWLYKSENTETQAQLKETRKNLKYAERIQMIQGIGPYRDAERHVQNELFEMFNDIKTTQSFILGPAETYEAMLANGFQLGEKVPYKKISDYLNKNYYDIWKKITQLNIWDNAVSGKGRVLGETDLKLLLIRASAGVAAKYDPEEAERQRECMEKDEVPDYDCAQERFSPPGNIYDISREIVLNQAFTFMQLEKYGDYVQCPEGIDPESEKGIDLRERGKCKICIKNKDTSSIVNGLTTCYYPYEIPKVKKSDQLSKIDLKH